MTTPAHLDPTGPDPVADRRLGGDRQDADWRGEFFRALFESLSGDEQRWVLDRIATYASLNAEMGDPARI